MARYLTKDKEEMKEEFGVETPQYAPVSTPTYHYSLSGVEDGGSGRGNSNGSRRSLYRNSDPGDEVFVRGSLVYRDIEAVEFSETDKPEHARDYKGRYRRWPGIMLILFLIGTAGALITVYAVKAHSDSTARAKVYEKNLFNSSKIAGGKGGEGDDIISDDGAIGNPKSYPPSQCELPNYLSKNGHIVAVSANGTEVPLKIKGINWFGMETGQAMPFGLWDNAENGTTAYQVAAFLAHNNFNAVRLPVMVSHILKNPVPNTAIINKNANRGIDVTSYMSLLKSIVKVLQYRKIGVLISMHTLTFSDNGKLWYNPDVSEADFLKSIDKLTAALCTKEYWNIMGIDLKNEPAAATWGDGTATDFNLGAQRIANQMLKGCPQWMGFVEGINSQHTVNLDGASFNYYDWYGGGLQGAKTKGLEFAVKDKVVWAPHYYTPAVYPQLYLFGGGTMGTGLQGYVELDDDALRRRIKGTMDDMFGFLASETGPAVLLGEFGGLYSTDMHPKKTTKRCTDFTIEIITKPGWAGGFVWSLNPESEYQYNPADTPGRFVEGIVSSDWLSANKEYLQAMAAMDKMDNLIPFPCFPTKATTSGSSTK